MCWTKLKIGIQITMLIQLLLQFSQCGSTNLCTISSDFKYLRIISGCKYSKTTVLTVLYSEFLMGYRKILRICMNIVFRLARQMLKMRVFETLFEVLKKRLNFWNRSSDLTNRTGNGENFTTLNMSILRSPQLLWDSYSIGTQRLQDQRILWTWESGSTQLLKKRRDFMLIMFLYWDGRLI